MRFLKPEGWGGVIWAGAWLLASSAAGEVMTASGADPLVITALRINAPMSAVPAQVTVISSAEFKATPARSLDDVLRVGAGVNTRGSSSNIINPAYQTVSMGGLFGTGALSPSRALVLLDGIPLNDGFGGWVTWSKVPVEIVERVELVRGAASSLYGTGAMSGVVSIVTRDPKERAADVNWSYGSRNTKRLNAYASDAFLGKVGLSVDYNYYQTDGYQWLQPPVLGPVDHNATARNWALHVKAASLEGGAGGPLWFVRGMMFNDGRNHGLDQWFDSRDEMEVAVGFRRPLDLEGELRGSAFFGKHLLDSTNAFVNAARTDQFTYVHNYLPSLDAGGSLQWTRPFEAMTSSATVGVDVRHVAARNDETDYTATGAYQTAFSSGGQQTDVGFYGQWSGSPLPGLTVVPSARVDYWSNHDAFQKDSAGRAAIPSQDFAFLSPRLAVRYQVAEPFAIRGGIYRAFVAPTLQNLYRGARPQNQIILPNPNLGPEILRIGSEFGWDLALGDLDLRVTGYWNELKNAIASVTLAPNVTQVKNISEVRSRSVAVEAPWRIARRWSFKPCYTYTEAVITGNSASPGTVGNMVPDVPRHQGAFKVVFNAPSLATAQLGGRYFSRRWGNDTNTQNLDEYFVLDLRVSRYITRNLEVYFDGENLLDRRYTVQQNGSLPVLGEPFYAGLGVRLHLR